jgi:putative hydrolase of the HAD superfamily
VSLTTLFFDLDGVLRLWPNDYSVLEAKHNLPVGSVAAVAFEPSLLERVTTGRLTDDQWRSEVGRRLSEAFPHSRAHEAVSAWSSPAGSVSADVLRLVIQARRVCKVGLITNATDRLSQDLATLGLAEHLDLIVNSSDVGVAKPHPEIFRYALSLASAQPAQAAFVDDTPSNVAAASALGIRAHHFTSAAGLRDFMQSIGLPSNAT